MNPRCLCLLLAVFAGGLVPALANPPPIELFTRRPLVGSVSISADGRHLVYLSADDKGRGTLAGLDFETMAPFSISLGGDDIYTLSWLTGDRIAFNVAMNRRWSRGLYTYRLGDKVAEGINEKDLTLVISVVREDPSRLYVWYYGAVAHRQKGLALIDTDRRRVAGMGRADDEFMVVRWVPAPPGEVLDWIADRTGQVRVGVTFHDGRKRVWIHGSDTERWSELPFDWEHASIAGFSMDGRALLVRTDDGGAKTDGLFLYDLESRSLGGLVFRDPDFGLDDVIVLRAIKDEAIVGIRYLRDRVTTHWMSERFRGYQAAIDERLPGRVNHIRDWDNAEARLIVEAQSDRQPGHYYVYSPKDGSLAALPAASPWIDPATMQPMQTVNYKARDGLPLQGYLTLPARAADGRKPPLVVMPHGGPWVRDVWGWDPHVQFLASRGYAVFQPNYRGSSGFTREVSGERTAFRQMYEDVADGAAVVARSGLVDPERIAIYGGSFGGYLAIAAAAFDPDRFKCAISFAGVFDWARLVDQTRFRREASYLRHLRKRDVGDPRTDEERFAEISPIKHVANIRIPLLLAHGGLDQVVEDAQTKALIAELRKHRVRHETLFFREEGHGFADPRNEERFLARLEQFLARNL